MDKNPLALVGMLLATAFAVKLWVDDFKAEKAGRANPRALPGATPVATRVLLYAAMGALVLLGLETWGESRLGLTAEQSSMTALFGVYTLAAAFIEELTFRGYIVIERHGRAALWGGVVAASALFALVHPFLWKWDGAHGGLSFVASPKGWFSTGAIFVGSLWFYAVRFWPLNARRSLLPCIAAHAAKNIGVFVIKDLQGFVHGVW